MWRELYRLSMTASQGPDYFALFGLEPRFDLDLEQLSLRYRELQRSAHPDRFANASSQERLLSVQQAALINEAYQVLRQPLSRGRYMLSRHGANLDDTDTRMDTAFLMEQMELREALAGVASASDSFEQLDKLRDRIEAMERDMVAHLQQLLQQPVDETVLDAGIQLVRKMQFTQRLLGEVDELEETLAHV